MKSWICEARRVAVVADVRVPLYQVRNVAGAMQGKARLMVYQGVPHLPIVEAERQEWSRHVDEFLRSIR